MNPVGIIILLLASVVIIKAMMPAILGILNSIWELFKIVLYIGLAIIVVAMFAKAFG